MKLNEFLTEEELDELNMDQVKAGLKKTGSAIAKGAKATGRGLVKGAELGAKGIKATGRGVGKVAGGTAAGIGAVAGGVAGTGRAMKKGFQAGRNVVGGDETPTAKPKAAPAVKMSRSARNAINILKKLSPQEKQMVIKAAGV